jgi:Mg-chelatase subunit ChlD
MQSLRYSVIVGAVVVASCMSPVQAADALTEKGLTAMIEAGFEEAEIIAKINKDGVDFVVDDGALDRLKTVGATEKVLMQVKLAANQPVPAAKPSVSFESVVSLLENGIESDLIIARLRKSAATFVLSKEQEEKLQTAGATAALIAAMKRGAKEADTSEPISDLVTVLDVSGSMKENTSDGRAKIEVAKEVVGDLVQGIPAGLNVSVVIYGHTQGCGAVKVLRPLKELKDTEKSGLISSIQELEPIGNTPIALALRRAGEQFSGRKTYCGIVLVTDGLESCNGDPSAEAAKLAENPMLRFGVNVVGFGLNTEESASTSGIAASGKGRFYDAKNSNELTEVIAEVTKRIGSGAKPAPFNPTAPKGRRAVVILKPEVAMPEMKELVICKPGAGDATIYAHEPTKVTNYDEELRQASAEKVDIWWVPVEGMPVRMVADFENPEREVKKLRPEDYLGMIRVTAKDRPVKTRIVVTTEGAGAGTLYAYDVQEIEGFNKDLVVPVGAYKLWVVEPDKKPTLLEEELQVAGGQLTEVEY